MGNSWDSRAAQKSALAAAPCTESVGFFHYFSFTVWQSLGTWGRRVAQGSCTVTSEGIILRQKTCTSATKASLLGVTSQKTVKSWLDLRLSFHYLATRGNYLFSHTKGVHVTGKQHKTRQQSSHRCAQWLFRVLLQRTCTPGSLLMVFTTGQSSAQGVACFLLLAIAT